jgi:hypothetical protein
MPQQAIDLARLKALGPFCLASCIINGAPSKVETYIHNTFEDGE